MSEKKLDLRIGQVRLEHLNVRLIPFGGDESGGGPRADSRVEVTDRDKERAKLRLSEHWVFGSVAPLEIEISIVGRCRVEPGITEDEIITAVKTAGYPLYATRSQAIGYVSGMAIGIPIIIPPYEIGQSLQNSQSASASVGAASPE